MKFNAEPYQGVFKDFLHTHDRAAGFLSPGLGKTSSTLTALNDRFLDGDCGSALIVAPLRVACLTWPNEIAKWDHTRWMRCESIRGRKPSGKSQIYTINYERLGELTDLSFVDTVVFDELTRAKNPQSKRIKAFRPLLKHHRRWGLTGTPRPNSLLEIFAQVRLLDDGERLGKSFDHFKTTYFTPTDYLEYNWVPKPDAEEEIYERIADLTLTMRASDYLDLPDTIVEDVEVPLPPAARAVYKELEKELVKCFGKNGNVVAQTAGILANKLLQVSGGSVYNEDRGVIEVHTAKIDALKALLKKHPKESVMIFTNYVHERERVVAAIGGTDAAKFKGDIEDAWNSGKIKRLVADPRSLGHGLNLQAGGRIIVWFSPNWSREYYDQANARLARKGQELQPLIYRLCSPGTMDDAVLETLRERGDGQAGMLATLTNWQKLREIA